MLQRVELAPDSDRLADNTRAALRAAYTMIMSWPKRQTANVAQNPDRESETSAAPDRSANSPQGIIGRV